MSKYAFNVNEYSIEKDERFFAYVNTIDANRIVKLLNKQDAEIKRLNKELKRCREWINSDKNDYELTLSFIKSKGFSLEDVIKYEKKIRKGKKMTENKRFDYEGKYVTMGNGVFVIAQTINDAELIAKTLNELYEENKQLKIEVMGQSEEIEILSDENKRLKQGKYVYGIHGGSNDRK